ncbi:MAG: hypothetical protein HQL29_06560 [Candidatus Omnitrophica bacterium]|nr:hypothetical protein [Candidatus Omnitrophota bacterium]
MKTLNKFLVNMGLFSVLSMLLVIPMVAITFAGFTNKTVESSEVLSAQDKAPKAAVEEETELFNDVPQELEELIRQVEKEMYRQQNAVTEDIEELTE